MKKQLKQRSRRYCVNADKLCVTTIVYLPDETMVIIKVFDDGNIETLINPP